MIAFLLFLQDLGTRKCAMTRGLCDTDRSLCRGYKSSKSDPAWYSPTSLSQVAALIRENPNAKFRFIAGDTGKGYYVTYADIITVLTITDIFWSISSFVRSFSAFV